MPKTPSASKCDDSAVGFGGRGVEGARKPCLYLLLYNAPAMTAKTSTASPVTCSGKA